MVSAAGEVIPYSLGWAKGVVSAREDTSTVRRREDEWTRRRKTSSGRRKTSSGRRSTDKITGGRPRRRRKTKKYHKSNDTDHSPKGLLLYVINESKKYL